MINTVSFYSDSQCTNPGQVIIPGVAAITGEKENVNNWTHCAWRSGMESISRGDILVSNARDLAALDGKIELSGGKAIYDCSIDQTIPYDDLVETDKVTEQSTGLIYNPYFIYFDEEDESSFVISISATSSTEQTYNYFKFGLMYYKQTPVGASKRDRETWFYNGDLSNVLALSDLLYLFKATSQWDSNMRQIKMYKVTLSDEKDYYLFAFGVTADGKYNDASNPAILSGGTNFIAVPTDYFKDKEPRPWVGFPAEDDSEEAFEPTEEKHDFIEQRELTEEQRNPFGINAGTGTGIKVVFPNLQGSGVLTRDNYLNYFLGCIYRGEAQGVFNRVEQTFSSVFNGNTNRPADQVNAMISAIICCHSIPWITNYASGTTAITSLGGYYLDLEGWGLHYYANGSAELNAYKAKATTLVTPGQKAIFDASFTSGVIAPKLNCFLDYEPYTKMTLQIPFFKPISVSPSMVYGHTITAKYRIDILTGFLYVDIYIGNVLTTSMSTNVKTDIPIIGQGANGGGLSKIMTAISSATNSTSDGAIVSNSISAGLQMADAVSNAKAGTVVGKEGNPTLSPYLSPRKAYLMTTHPKAAIPVAQNGQFTDATFLNQFGMRANLAYKLSELSGGWNKISTINLSTVNAPQHIKEDIIAKLREGVYIK